MGMAMAMSTIVVIVAVVVGLVMVVVMVVVMLFRQDLSALHADNNGIRPEGTRLDARAGTLFLDKVTVSASCLLGILLGIALLVLDLLLNLQRGLLEILYVGLLQGRDPFERRSVSQRRGLLEPLFVVRAVVRRASNGLGLLGAVGMAMRMTSVRMAVARVVVEEYEAH